MSVRFRICNSSYDFNGTSLPDPKQNLTWELKFSYKYSGMQVRSYRNGVVGREVPHNTVLHQPAQRYITMLNGVKYKMLCESCALRGSYTTS